MNRHSFSAHIKEAIAINRKRKPLYASITCGKSKKLSNLIIFLQYCLLPVAKIFDRIGSKHNRKEIPIIANDFVSLENLPSHTQPVKRKNIADTDTFETIQGRLTLFAKNIHKKTPFEEIFTKTHNELVFIKQVEDALSSNFSLLKHLLESICFISRNSISYERKSNGATSSLSYRLILLHILFLRKILFIDRWAQKFHQEDVGILVNDMPSISLNTRAYT